MLYLNTSHVKVNRRVIQYNQITEANLNTSHVKVNHKVFSHLF